MQISKIKTSFLLLFVYYPLKKNQGYYSNIQNKQLINLILFIF
jgi:hypothetical protein